MARIARNIELYNSAYSLAWKKISEPEKRELPDVALRLTLPFDASLRTEQPSLSSLPPSRLRRLMRPFVSK
jgi:hypothetical protein